MVKSIVGWFKGLFAPRTKAQGLSSEPTYSQVERLIEAAGGASAQGGSLYSKPTYSQFERLIAAVAASSSSGSAEVARLDGAKRDKGDLSTYAYPVTPGYWTSGEDRFDPVDGAFPTSKNIYTWACGDNRIQYNPTNGNIYRAFSPTATAQTTLTNLDPRKPGVDLKNTAVDSGGAWQIGNDGRTFSYTPAVEGDSLEEDGDRLAKKSEIPSLPLQAAGIADGAVVNAKLGNGAVTRGKIADSAVDSTPTAESNNLVTSGGVRASVDGEVQHVWSNTPSAPNRFVDGNRQYGFAARTWTRSDASTIESYDYEGLDTSTGLHTWYTQGKAKKLTYSPSSGEVKSDGYPIAALAPGLNLWTVKIAPIELEGGKVFTYTDTPSYHIIGTFAFLSDIPSVEGKENASNKVTSLTDESTDEQYPSAKCVYDALQGAGAKPTRIYNENGSDALDDKGQLFDSVVETGGHWEVDVVDNQGYDNGHHVYTYVGIVNGKHCWSLGGSTSAFWKMQIVDGYPYWSGQFSLSQPVPSGVDPTSTSGSESMAGTYTGKNSRHTVTAVYVPQRAQIQSDPYAHFALESLPDRTWASGVWAAGDLVKHDGKAYRCKAAAKLSDTAAPSSDTTHWTEVPVLTGVTQLFAGRSLPQAPTQNEVAEVVKEIFNALGGTISTTSSNEDNP